MRVQVLGSPRGGTRCLAALFHSAGWKVGHEEILEDGISSWQWAVRSPWVPWGDARGDHPRAENLIHVLRDPRTAIPSIVNITARSEHWRSQWVFVPPNAHPFERAVFSYVGWHALIRARGPDYVTKLETAEDPVSKLTGCRVSPIRDPFMRNERPHPVASEDEITTHLSRSGRDAWDRALELWEEAE